MHVANAPAISLLKRVKLRSQMYFILSVGSHTVLSLLKVNIVNVGQVLWGGTREGKKLSYGIKSSSICVCVPSWTKERQKMGHKTP